MNKEKIKLFSGNVIPIIVVCLSILGSFFTYLLAEKSKQDHEDYIRKEERYIKLISAVKGFTEQQSSSELKQEFIDQLNLCWLYCSDSVIIKGYDFLDQVTLGQNSTSEQKKEALGKFMIEIRHDLIDKRAFKETNLKPSNFKLLRPI